MPYYVVQKTTDALNERGKSVRGARILVLGLAYKKDVNDSRESPSLRLMELFEAKGALVNYHDPYIPEAPRTRRYHFHKSSVPLTADNLARYDCVLIATDHSTFDPAFIVAHAPLVIDTRNLTGALKESMDKVVKA